MAEAEKKRAPNGETDEIDIEALMEMDGAGEGAAAARPEASGQEEAPAEPDAAEAAAAEIARLTAERDDMRDRFMRALAETENVRKRAERDRREAESYGGSRLARDLLPVHDNLARALEAAGEAERAAAAGVIEGVELTLRELLAVLGRHGVKPLTPEIGDKFDPQMHQAMFEAPVPGTRAGEIIQVMAQGFTLHERLLRPAQVGVSSTPAS